MRIENHRLVSDRVEHLDSPNKGGEIEPTVLVLHYTASGGDNGRGDAEYLSRRAAGASAHLVTGRDASIYQLVDFNRKAWHAGRSSFNGQKNVNNFSIGIEIDNWGWLTNGRSHSGVEVPEDQIFYGERHGRSQWEKYPQAQLDAVEELVALIIETYPSIKHIVGHEEISPGRKQDPGPALDDFMNMLKDKYVKQEAQPETKEVSAKGTKEVKASGLRLRLRPAGTASILTTAVKGTKVRILKENYHPGWDKVQLGKRVGFMANRYLT